MKAKCAKGSCGYEFENQDESVFFDEINKSEATGILKGDEGFLLIIDIKSYGCYGYVFCPVCGSKCVGLNE